MFAKACHSRHASLGSKPPTHGEHDVSNGREVNDLPFNLFVLKCGSPKTGLLPFNLASNQPE